MKNKINGSLIGLSLISIIITSILLTSVYYNNFKLQVEDDLKLSAKLLASTDYFDSDNIDFSVLNKEVRITLIDKSGIVLYDNDVNDKLDNHLNRKEIADAIKYGEGNSTRTSNTLNMVTYYYAIMLKDGRILRLSKDAKSITAIFLNTLPFAFMLVALIMIACLIISKFLTMQLIKPINELADNLDNANLTVPYKELIPITDKIRKQHTDILEASKMRQEFTANVSHELKTPLTSIMGYSELLKSQNTSKEQKEHFIDEILKNADRLLSLIDDIIKVTKLSSNEVSFEFMDVNLYEIAKSQVKNYDIEAKKKNITLEVNGKDLVIKANDHLIEELIDNLLQNSIRYGNNNGHVWINIYENNNRKCLSVEDDGIGIPLSEQDRIFERFYRVDKSRSKKAGGTGLGLAIVKHIVEIHNAEIKLTSTPGVGTKIEVFF